MAIYASKMQGWKVRAIKIKAYKIKTLRRPTLWPKWIDDPLIFNLPLKSNIFPTRGTKVPTFSRSTTGTVVDFEGVIHTAKIDEVRFAGARRVENLLEKSEDFSDDVWAKTATATVTGANTINLPNDLDRVSQSEPDSVAGKYAISIVLSGTGTISIGSYSIGDGLQLTQVTLTSTPTRFSYLVDITTPISMYSAYKQVGDTATQVTATKAQLEKVSGTQTEASEYVSTGVSVQTGEELVVNGGFDNGTDDWSSGSGGLLSAPADQLIVEVAGGDTGGNGYQVVPTIIGKIYKFTGTKVSQDANSSWGVSSSSATSNRDLVNIAGGVVGEYTGFFRATTTTSYIQLWGVGSPGNQTFYDNISVKEEYYHGANVDSVKYFDTDRSGVKIDNADLKGYLNEPAGTNLITYSEDLSNWALFTNVVIDSNLILAPDSTLTADKLYENGINGLHGTTTNSTTAVIGNIYTYSVLAKGTERFLQLTFGSGDVTDNPYVNFDLDNGIFSESGTIKGKMEERYDGWYRCSIIATAAVTINFNAVVFLIENYMSIRGGAYQGDGSSGLYIWGVNLKEGKFPTSYVKTEATTVTRTADSLSVDNPNRDVLPNSFCLAGTWTPLGGGVDYEAGDVRLFGSQDSRGVMHEHRTGGSIGYYYTAYTGGSLLSIKQSDINQLIPNKYALQVFQDGSNVNAKIYKDGIQKLSEIETQTLDHSNLTLELGSWAGSVFACYQRDIKIYNKELSNVKLVRLTS